MSNSFVGRFNLLYASQLKSPNKCGVCGSYNVDNDVQFIDVDMWVEYYGNIYFCVPCWVAATQLLNTDSHIRLAESLQQVTELQHVVNSLIMENRGLRDDVDNLRRLLASRPEPSSDNANMERIEGSGAGQVINEPEWIPENNRGITEGEEGLTEQTSVTGPSDVQNDDKYTDVDKLFSSFGL